MSKETQRAHAFAPPEGRDADARKRAEERLAAEVCEEFERRRAERRFLERGWELNMNFLSGNQYCRIGPDGEIEQEEPRFYWQYRRVFNHIAPAIDTRLAKLARVRPNMTVRAATGEEGDLYTAKVCASVLRSVCDECAFGDVVSRATMWSETCGTSFYKVLWSGEGAGGVRIAALPPFEIYPENLGCERVEDQPSIIHAKAVPVSEIFERYGVKLAGRDIAEFSFSPYSEAANFAGGAGRSAHNALKNCELVIEYYQKPCADFPNGRLIVVAGGKLVHCGDLPYKNGERGGRGYPFIKQCALHLAGAFFGASVIDRMIPVQRAYNALKNRQHEFLNRLTMGVLAVEDGSVDTEELLEEGLPPGKVLVYRQGAAAPKMLGADAVPYDFRAEEERLLDEFILVSGVSEISSSTRNRTNVTSATGLQLLIDLDDTRLSVTVESIRRAAIAAGKHILRLMRQFAGEKRLMRMAGEGEKVKMYYFSASDISSDDVIFEADSENADSPSQRRSLLYELYRLGVLEDENGKVPVQTKEKVLDALGFGGLEQARGITAMHTNKAAEENLLLMKGDAAPDWYDDDAAHIAEHTRFALSDEFKRADAGAKQRFTAHIRAHESQKREKAQVSQVQGGAEKQGAVQAES